VHLPEIQQGELRKSTWSWTRRPRARLLGAGARAPAGASSGAVLLGARPLAIRESRRVAPPPRRAAQAVPADNLYVERGRDLL